MERVLSLKVDSRGVVTGLKTVERSFDKTEKRARRFTSNTQKTFTKLLQQTKMLNKSIVGLGTSISALNAKSVATGQSVLAFTSPLMAAFGTGNIAKGMKSTNDEMTKMHKSSVATGASIGDMLLPMVAVSGVLSKSISKTTEAIKKQTSVFSQNTGSSNVFVAARERAVQRTEKMVKAGKAHTDQLVRERTELALFKKQMDAASKSSEKFAKAQKSSIGSLVAFGTAITGLLAAGKTVSNIVRISRETQTLTASLVSVTGSTNEAAEAFKYLNQLSQRMPETTSDVVRAFIKMKSLGLAPTEAGLLSFSNTASAMGKSLMDFIEAVADASTNEFERLKEFGIKSKQQGDKVSFTFQGVTTTIGKNSNEIVKYLEKIGMVQFAGAAANQMKTLDGEISNLSNSMDNFWRTLSKGAISGFFKNVVRWTSETFGFMENQIVKVQFVGITAIDLLMKAVITLKTGFKVMSTTIGWAWDTTVAGIKDVWFKAIDALIEKYNSMAKSFVGQSFGLEPITKIAEGSEKAVSSLRSRLSLLADEQKADMAIHNKVIDMWKTEAATIDLARIALSKYNEDLKKQKNNEVLPGAPAPMPGGDPAAQMAMETRKRIATLEQGLMTEEERLHQSYLRRTDMINSAMENLYISEDAAMELRLQVENDYQDKLTAITNRGLSEREKFNRMSTKNQVKDVLGFLTNLTSGISQYNRTAFRINQVASVATATMNTYEGATKALAKYPPPWGEAAAGAVIASGLAQVNAIKNQTFGGGTGGSGVITPAPTIPSEIVSPNTTSEQPKIEVNLTIVDPYGSVKDQLTRDINDHGEILIDPASQNGQVLAAGF